MPAKDNQLFSLFRIISIPLFIASLLLNVLLLYSKNTPTQNTGVDVIGVSDGDTFILEGKYKIRLRQIDAPELAYCGGPEAKKTLEKLVLNKKVRLDEQIPDQYGRGMALAYVGDTLVNEEILRQGWARYHHDISSKSELLKTATKEAEDNNLGIYAMCQSKTNTEKPSCSIKGNIDKSTNTRIYYTPDCAQYAFTVVEKDLGEAWFCTEKEAVNAGYTKAKTCK